VDVCIRLPEIYFSTRICFDYFLPVFVSNHQNIEYSIFKGSGAYEHNIAVIGLLKITILVGM
jgi:hypothetical protein